MLLFLLCSTVILLPVVGLKGCDSVFLSMMFVSVLVSGSIVSGFEAIDQNFAGFLDSLTCFFILRCFMKFSSSLGV